MIAISNLPTPPAKAPEPNRIGNVAPAEDKRSAYWGMDTQATVTAYLKRLRAIKVQSIVLILTNLIAAIWFVEVGNLLLYGICFAFMFGIALVARVRMGTLFINLGEVVSQDCDPARYRAVLDVLAERDRFGRSVNTIAIERAYCDYLELDSVGALKRLESVTFKRKDNLRWFRALQIEFLGRIDVGDIESARDALARLSAFRQNFKEGSRNRVSADMQVADYAVLVRPPAERDAADAARMCERMMLADCHQQRVNWQLYLAEYELLHGSPEEAARLASDPTLNPVTPRMERLRSEIFAGLEVH